MEAVQMELSAQSCPDLHTCAMTCAPPVTHVHTWEVLAPKVSKAKHGLHAEQAPEHPHAFSHDSKEKAERLPKPIGCYSGQGECELGWGELFEERGAGEGWRQGSMMALSEWDH